MKFKATKCKNTKLAQMGLHCYLTLLFNGSRTLLQQMAQQRNCTITAQESWSFSIIVLGAGKKGLLCKYEFDRPGQKTNISTQPMKEFCEFN